MTAPDPETQSILIKQAILQGDKIRAIKLYREQTGLGLAESKQAIERLELQLREGHPNSFTLPSTDAVDSSPESQALLLKEAVFRGDLVAAIKLYHDQTGLGLKDSKEAVERLEAELRQSSPDRFCARSSRGGPQKLVAFVVAIAVVATLLLLVLIRLKLAS